MANFYYNRIVMGRCGIEDVPKKWREEVRQMLENDGYEFGEDGYIINGVGQKLEVM